MRAGQLRNRVEIQEKSVSRDEYGAEVVTWVEVATVWASVEPVSGSERWIGGLDQTIAERTTRIRIRYMSGIDATMRVVFGDLVYDIEQVIQPWMRGRELQLICREVNPSP